MAETVVVGDAGTDEGAQTVAESAHQAAVAEEKPRVSADSAAVVAEFA